MIPLIIMVVIAVLSLLGSFKAKPLKRFFILRRMMFILGAMIIVWCLSILMLCRVEPGMDYNNALYWVLTMGLSTEPLRAPPSSPIAHFILLADSVFSYIILAFVITAVVEYFMRKTIEGAKGLYTRIERDKDHIVIIGWSKASEEAYKELKRIIGDRRKFVIIDHPDKVEMIKKEIKSPIDEVIGGDPCSEEAIERARVWKADKIIISLDDDSKSLLALLQVKHVIAKHSEEVEKPILIIVEALKDENEPLLRAAGTGKHVSSKVVISRSLVGRIMADALMKPGVMAFLCDATSATYGIISLNLIKASSLIQSPTRFKELQERLLMERDPSKRMIILCVVRRSGDIVRRYANPSLDMVIEPSDDLIVLAYELAAREPEIIDLGAEKAFPIDKYCWVRPGSLNKLWKMEPRGGHITVIGWTEATETFINEIIGARGVVGIPDGTMSPGQLLDKTLIVLASKHPQTTSVSLDDIVLVIGDYTSTRSIRRAGTLTADVIVVSTEEDHVTTHVMLQVKGLLEEAARGEIRGRGPIKIAETSLEVTARLLLDNDLADVAIPSRSFGGRLLAYAALDPEVYAFIEDLVSAVTGVVDLREIMITRRFLREIGRPESVKFIELFRILKERYEDKMPLAIITKVNGVDAIIYIPDPDRIVKEGDRVILLEHQQR